MTNVHRAGTVGVERKVSAATFGAYIAGVLGLAVVDALNTNQDLIIAGLPGPVAWFVAPLVPTAVTFLSGYLARHTPR